MIEPLEARRLTRRQLVKRVGGAAGVLALGGAASGAARLLGRHHAVARGGAVPPREALQTFRSRPDLRPTAVVTDGASSGPGYLFIGPGSKGGSQSGPLIVDDSGEPVWFRPLPKSKWATNFAASRWRGHPVLVWWEGEVEMPSGYGLGEAVMLDAAYREVGRIGAANGRRIDMHEFRLTPEGTALFTCYPESVQVDLSPAGGRGTGTVLESIFQEVDLRTGRLLMEWRGLEHIPLAESYRPLETPYDYLHLNSIDIAPDGHLLVSARHTWALYKVHRRTGEVLWRLGGKRSDFTMGEGARFSWQHDARQLDESTITVFDNGSYGPSQTESQSRALALNIDEPGRSVRLGHACTHPQPLSASAMGSVQTLANGNLLVCWGTEPFVSQFAPDGRLLEDAAMFTGQQSYKAFRLPWTGFPQDRPAVAAARDPATGVATLFASWNGSTEVTHWRVHAGRAGSRLAHIGIVERSGFETAIPLARDHRFAAVSALDGAARRLATSPTIRL